MLLLTEMWCLEQGYSSVFSSLLLSRTVFLSTSSTHSLSSLCPPLPSERRFLSRLFSIFPPPVPSLTYLPHRAALLLSVLTSAHTSPSLFPPSPTPTQLPPSSVIPISWPFQGNHSSWVLAQRFLKYVSLIQVMLRHEPGSYFPFLWHEAALWTGRQCLIEA